MNKDELWQALLAQVQFNISKANFATWFKNTGVSLKKDGQVIVSVPNNFSKEWLENKYNKLIFKILHNLDEEIKEVKYSVDHPGLKTGRAPAVVLDSYEGDVPQLEFQELKINRESNLNPRYTFESFIVGPFTELAQAAAWAVAKNPGATYNPLFLYGGVGLGKTHLLQAICNEIKKGNPRLKALYTSSERFTSEHFSSMQSNG